MVVPQSDLHYSKPPFEVADVFRLFGDDYLRNHSLPSHHLRVIRDILNCRTSALGGHIDECDNCGFQSISYNSCRNRHCPKCQASARRRWVEARIVELLPIEYFHIVFTLPDSLNSLALFNPSLIYNLLFKAASETLLEFGQRNLGGQIGITAVLHTWGQTLAHHIHLHCIVTGIALSDDRSEFKTSNNGFLFPTRALSLVFRGKMIDYLTTAFTSDQLIIPPSEEPFYFGQLRAKLRKHRWVVYAKKPFAGPVQLISYIGRYTHRTAIANHRIVDIREGKVTFLYKDYRDGEKRKTMTVSGEEFIRRFLLHILPEEFVRIRHYGLLANGKKKANLERCRLLLDCQRAQTSDWQTESEQTDEAEDEERDRCPACETGRLIRKRETEPIREEEDMKEKLKPAA